MLTERRDDCCKACGRPFPLERVLTCVECGAKFVQRGYGRSRKTCDKPRCQALRRKLHRMGIASLED